MKKLALAAAAASVLFTGAASAADLAPRYTKAAPLAAPAYDWSGFYLGVNVGGGSAATPFNDATGDFFSNTTIVKGFATGGAQIGYNYQIGSGVVGFEADVNANSIKHSSIISSDSIPFVAGLKSDVSGTIRGRGGLAINNTLLYVTGGAAWANVSQSGAELNFNTRQPDGVTADSSKALWGAVIGAGFEIALTPNWSAGAEFLHTMYQHSNASIVSANGSSFCSTVTTPANCVINSQLTTDVARVRFNYKIN